VRDAALPDSNPVLSVKSGEGVDEGERDAGVW